MPVNFTQEDPTGAPKCIIRVGDSLQLLKGLADNSVDSCVVDPPYGLGKEPDALEMLKDWLRCGHHDHTSKSGFCGHEWDAFVPQPALWKEVLRVLKPGGYILCFAGSRTQDLMGLSLRLAGFELKETLMWVYASGMSKGQNIAKAIDKMKGLDREVLGVDEKARRPNAESAHKEGQVGDFGLKAGGAGLITKNMCAESEQWEGWNTQLKPAYEPILMCRKPISESTIAKNVLKWGVGALNIGASRVPLTSEADKAEFANNHRVTERLPEEYGGEKIGLHEGGWKYKVGEANIPAGRYPATFIHDGSGEVLAEFPDTAGESASRFFFCAKVGTAERHAGVLEEAPAQFEHGDTLRKVENKTGGKVGNHHPTLKPLALMHYLVRMVTPPGGLVLDPMMGAGSTGIAAGKLGMGFIGFDLDPEYVEISRKRMEYHLKNKAPKTVAAPIGKSAKKVALKCTVPAPATTPADPGAVKPLRKDLVARILKKKSK